MRTHSEKEQKTDHALRSSGGRDVDDVVLPDVALGRIPAHPEGVGGGVGHLQVLHSAQRL